jgi:hypothetical protein
MKLVKIFTYSINVSFVNVNPLKNIPRQEKPKLSQEGKDGLKK